LPRELGEGSATDPKRAIQEPRRPKADIERRIAKLKVEIGSPRRHRRQRTLPAVELEARRYNSRNCF
jgi:hypothetical protein